MAEPDGIKIPCPRCKEIKKNQGDRSAYTPYGYCTNFYHEDRPYFPFKTFVDKDGKFHDHTPLRFPVPVFVCQRNHHFSPNLDCWCGYKRGQ